MGEEVIYVRPNLKVKTKAELGNTNGFMIKPERLAPRKPNTVGYVIQYVPGHGGDVWWVGHEGTDEVASYCFDEFEPFVHAPSVPKGWENLEWSGPCFPFDKK